MCVLLFISSHKKQLRSILVNILTVSLLFATSEHETPYNQFGVWFCTKMANYCSPEITHLLYFVHVAIQNKRNPILHKFMNINDTINCKHGLPVIKLQTDRCLDHIELKINLQL